jgi:hypothetical protein
MNLGKLDNLEADAAASYLLAFQARIILLE